MRIKLEKEESRSEIHTWSEGVEWWRVHSTHSIHLSVEWHRDGRYTTSNRPTGLGWFAVVNGSVKSTWNSARFLQLRSDKKCDHTKAEAADSASCSTGRTMFQMIPVFHLRNLQITHKYEKLWKKRHVFALANYQLSKTKKKSKIVCLIFSNKPNSFPNNNLNTS